MPSQRLLRRTGTALLMLGATLNVWGLTHLRPKVEGTYINRSVGASPTDVEVAGSVGGSAWIIVGTTLMVLGGGAAVASSTRRS